MPGSIYWWSYPWPNLEGKGRVVHCRPMHQIELHHVHLVEPLERFRFCNDEDHCQYYHRNLNFKWNLYVDFRQKWPATGHLNLRDRKKNFRNLRSPKPDLYCIFKPLTIFLEKRKVNRDDLSPDKDHPVMTRIIPKPFQLNSSILIYSGLNSVKLYHFKEIF